MIQQLPLEYAVRGTEERRKVNLVLAAIWPHSGRAAAVSMHAIAADTGLSTRLIQAIVKFLVEERHVAIGTATAPPYGYYRISTNDERRAVRDQFVRRALSNLNHAKAYDSDSIVAPLIGQVELQFPEAKR